MAFYETLKLEKGMYSAPGKSFTQALEELDPSENYRGTPLEGLDAVSYIHLEGIDRVDFPLRIFLRQLLNLSLIHI